MRCEVKAAQSAPPSRCCSSPQTGATPLHIAAQKGHLDVVKAMLAAGCNKDAAKQASHATRHNIIGVHEAVCVRVCLCRAGTQVRPTCTLLTMCASVVRP